MSFAGILTFKKNLESLMDSDAFKRADDGERLRMGGSLLRSSYGACGMSVVKQLMPEKDTNQGNTYKK